MFKKAIFIQSTILQSFETISIFIFPIKMLPVSVYMKIHKRVTARCVIITDVYLTRVFHYKWMFSCDPFLMCLLMLTAVVCALSTNDSNGSLMFCNDLPVFQSFNNVLHVDHACICQECSKTQSQYAVIWSLLKIY